MHTQFGSNYETDGKTRSIFLDTITHLTQILKINSENVKKVLESFKQNINDLINTPLSQEELNRAKMAIKGEIISQLKAQKAGITNY